MSCVRCTSCGSFFETRRFDRCPICRHEAPAPAAQDPAAAAQVPELEKEAARDGRFTGGASAVGVLLAMVGLATLLRLPIGWGPVAAVGGVLLLVLFVVFAARGKKKESTASADAGGVVLSALGIVAMVIGGIIVLIAGGVILLFVVCITSSGGGFGS